MKRKHNDDYSKAVCDVCGKRAVHICGPSEFYCNDHMPGWSALGKTLAAAALAEIEAMKEGVSDAEG